MRDLKSFYVVVHNAEVIAYATNLDKFIFELKKLPALSGILKSYSTYRNYFKKDSKIIVLGNDKEVYTFQKVI